MSSSRFDFDPATQVALDAQFGNLACPDWRGWLDIGSLAEFEEAVFHYSGVPATVGAVQAMRGQVTTGRSLSVAVGHYLQAPGTPAMPVICHTSGTSGGALKWFPFSRELVQHTWGPGMRAIFETSGLDARGSAIIFVPSRIEDDGVARRHGKQPVFLYSAEFSQRLVLSLVKPAGYLIDAYRNATSLEKIAGMLALENVAVVSAPALTLLKWADREKLRQGIEASRARLKHDSSSMQAAGGAERQALADLVDLVDREGGDAATAVIQGRLSDHLAGATAIFSSSSLSPAQWQAIRDFFQWPAGAERVTNLYVASEIGPFAASIHPDADPAGGSPPMLVFPVTVPTLESRGKRTFLWEVPDGHGELAVSRVTGLARYYQRPWVPNLLTGDVVELVPGEGAPRITGKILRAAFPLKRAVTIAPYATVPVPTPHEVLVGDYFELDFADVSNSRELLRALQRELAVPSGASLLLTRELDKPWEMVVPTRHARPAGDEVLEALRACPSGRALARAVAQGTLEVTCVAEDPVAPEVAREEIVAAVRAGKLPKGALKRWPLYVVVPGKAGKPETEPP